MVIPRAFEFGTDFEFDQLMASTAPTFKPAPKAFGVGAGNLPRQCASTAGRTGTQAVTMMAMIQFNLGKTFQIQLA